MRQIQPNEFTATLLRRVAHAVDGFRAGHLVYVVVDTQRPYRVRKVVRQKGDDPPIQRLERLCEEGGATYKWTGPYKTFAGLDDPWIIECHEFDSDPCQQGDVTGATINPPGSGRTEESGTTDWCIFISGTHWCWKDRTRQGPFQVSVQQQRFTDQIRYVRVW